MNGGNVFDLQKILGHTKVDMTMRYAHFSPEHLQSTISYMNMGIKLDLKNPTHNPTHKEENHSFLRLVQDS